MISRNTPSTMAVKLCPKMSLTREDGPYKNLLPEMHPPNLGTKPGCITFYISNAAWNPEFVG